MIFAVSLNKEMEWAGRCPFTADVLAYVMISHLGNPLCFDKLAEPLKEFCLKKAGAGGLAIVCCVPLLEGTIHY